VLVPVIKKVERRVQSIEKNNYLNQPLSKKKKKTFLKMLILLYLSRGFKTVNQMKKKGK
jgi:hypothetical protein